MIARPLSPAMLRAVPLAIAAASLAGCVSRPPDGGFAAVSDAVRKHLQQDAVWARTDDERAASARRVEALLAKPLSADDAVQIALLNNKALQAQYAELGIGEAELMQAGTPPNIGFSMRRTARGADVSIEQSLTTKLLALITLPRAVAIAGQRLAETQALAAQRTLDTAFAARKAWVAAVAAEQSAKYMEQVRIAADASAELAARMAQVGNFNKLQQAREQSFRADAALGVVRAEHARQAARERLIRVLGLWGEQLRFTLPERLPELPLLADELPDVERTALAQRFDVKAALFETNLLADSLGLTRATRYIDVLEAGPAREREPGEPYRYGVELSIELPLFDWGTARVAKAEATYMRAVDRAAGVAIDARSEIRDAYRSYRASFDVARQYRDEIVPLRKRIAEENQLRYNGMLIGVFDLLADARAQIATVNAYVDALRDFWIAKAELDQAHFGPGGRSALATRDRSPASASAQGEH
jgi:outer membrane protein TolC